MVASPPLKFPMGSSENTQSEMQLLKIAKIGDVGTKSFTGEISISIDSC